jgi:hypothetical protein
VIGRRVGSIDEIERAGDYCLTTEVDAEGNPVGRGVWFLLPCHTGTSKFERVSRCDGLHRVSEPPWVFRECDDGSIEIRESIACGRHEPEGEYFHGYLDEGHSWRSV